MDFIGSLGPINPDFRVWVGKLCRLIWLLFTSRQILVEIFWGEWIEKLELVIRDKQYQKALECFLVTGDKGL